MNLLMPVREETHMHVDCRLYLFILSSLFGRLELECYPDLLLRRGNGGHLKDSYSPSISRMLGCENLTKPTSSLLNRCTMRLVLNKAIRGKIPPFPKVYSGSGYRAFLCLKKLLSLSGEPWIRLSR